MLSTSLALAGVTAIAALVVVSAFFSSAEIAVFSLETHRLEALAERGAAVGPLRRLKADPHRLLVTILVGNNVVNIAIASIATALLVEVLPAGEATVVSTVVVSFVVLLFGEIVPKSYGVANAETWAIRVARPIGLLQRLLYPLVVAFDALSGAINRLTGGNREIERPYVTREELTALVRTAERLGVIRSDQEEMIQRVFRFSGTPVGDVVVPRADVVAVAADATVAEALEVCATERVTRAPVYEGSLDTVVGYVDVRDLVAARGRDANTRVRDLVLPILHVFEGRDLDAVLAQLQDERVEMAVVFDQYGTLEGLVTVEDIVEEVFGEIYDVGESQYVTRIDARSVTARGKATLGAVAAALDLEPPGDPNATMAGLVVERLGRPAEPGDVLAVDGLRITVTLVEENRVVRVLVEHGEPSAQPSSGA
jgi:CBS domain containing-hemolysin-like protein